MAPDPNTSKNGYFIQSIEAAAKVAECFTDTGKHVMSLVEISAHTGYTKNRVFRIISTLTDMGYMLRDDSGSGYSLGAGFLPLGEHVRNRANLRERAIPFLDEMVKKTNDAGHLYTTLGDEMVCVVNRIGNFTLQASGPVGERIPLHIGPAKVILAYRNEAEIEAYLSSVDIIPYTDATVTDRVELLSQLKVIRGQGFCADHEEFEDGCHAYSAPVRDIRGVPIGALALAVPTIRNTAEKEQEVVDLVVAASRQVSAQLGFVE